MTINQLNEKREKEEKIKECAKSNIMPFVYYKLNFLIDTTLLPYLLWISAALSGVSMHMLPVDKVFLTLAFLWSIFIFYIKFYKNKIKNMTVGPMTFLCSFLLNFEIFSIISSDMIIGYKINVTLSLIISTILMIGINYLIYLKWMHKYDLL